MKESSTQTRMERGLALGEKQSTVSQHTIVRSLKISPSKDNNIIKMLVTADLLGNTALKTS